MNHKNIYLFIYLLTLALSLFLSSACDYSNSGKEDGVLSTKEPGVISTEPANGNRMVDPNSNIKIEFNQDIDSNSITNNKFWFRDMTAGKQDVSFSLKFDNSHVVSLVPTAPLVPGHSYEIIIAGRKENDIVVQEAYLLKFRVRLAKDIFTATEVHPLDHEQNTPIDTIIFVTFSETPDWDSITKKTFILSNDGTNVRGKFKRPHAEYLPNSITFEPDYALSRDITYTITLEGITTKNTTKEIAPVNSSFTTSKYLLLKQPELTIDSVILGFDGGIDMETINKNPDAIVVNETIPSGSPMRVEGHISYVYALKRLIFKANKNFTPNAEVTVTISDKIKDISGATLKTAKTVQLVARTGS